MTATTLADRRSCGLAAWLERTRTLDGKQELTSEIRAAPSPVCFITVPRTAT